MPVELSDAISPAAATMRTQLLAVRRWALAQGVPVDADVLALVLAAKSELRGEPVTRWRRLDVYQHLWADVRNWCSTHSTMVPENVPEILWLYFSYLDETDGFAEGSDPIRELRKPLRCYGGLGPDGLQAKPGAPQPRCVCKVPYRRRG
ncbi:MAG: hypothetical protein Q8K72_01400 [Acidimicrobiales bacterium]|nr:hypothetical protein [Acidimicrobiales bacterium]